MVCRNSQAFLDDPVSTTALNFNSGLINNISTSLQKVSSSFDLQKLKTVTDVCANKIQSYYSETKTNPKGKLRPFNDSWDNSFVNVSTSIVRKNSTVIKRTIQPNKSTDFKSSNKARVQTVKTVSSKNLHRIKLNSNGRPVSNRSDRMPTSNLTRSSILMKRLTDTRSNIQLKRKDQDNSVGKYNSTKVDRHRTSINKNDNGSSKKPKQQNRTYMNESESKIQQNIPMSRSSVNIFDNYVSNFHSNMVPKHYYVPKRSQQNKTTRKNLRDNEVTDY